jgi:hypothetical protein
MGNRSPGLKEWSRLLPTPTASDAMSAGSRNLPGSKAHRGTTLTDAARRPHLLPTPTAKLGDAKRGLPSKRVAQERWNQGRRNLDDAAVLLPTPDARCWRSGKGRKENGHSPQLEAVAGGQLSVPFVEQMMGLPTRWTALPASQRSAMRRSRSKRPPPSAS